MYLQINICSLLFLALVCRFSATAQDADSSALRETRSNYTVKEIEALDKLRILVETELYKDYMKEDRYLIRFLRAKKLYVPDAKEMILRSLVWRKSENIDEILNEANEVEKAMPYSMGLDRELKPFGSLRVGEWRIRRIILSGKTKEMIRVLHKLLEYSEQKTREAAVAVGRPISQGTLIMDLNGFNTRESACIQCLQVYFELFGAYENYYPQIFNKIILVNSPRIFQSIWDVVQPSLSRFTRDSVTIYGFDQNEWRSTLMKYISQDQLPRYLGGNSV